MNRLTEASCYKDVEEYIKDKEWDSKTVASKIVWYAKSCGFRGYSPTTTNENTREKHAEVYYWLIEYQSKFNQGVFFKHKKSAIKMLEGGASVREVFDHFSERGIQVSKVTLHKYRNDLLLVEGTCSCEGLGKQPYLNYCKYCEAYMYFQEGSSLQEVYNTFKNINQEMSKLRLKLIQSKVGVVG